MIVKTLLQRVSSTIFFICAFLYASGIAAQGNPPSISNTGTATLNYQEGRAPVTLVPNIIVEDGDSQNMLLATFSFGGNYQSNQDTLVFEQTENIKAHFEESSGTLRLLSLSANQGVSIAQMRTAMASVGYRITSDNPSNKTIAVNISVTDLEGNQSNTATRSINVSPTNDAPEISSSTTATINIVNDEEQIFDDVEITDPDNGQMSRVEIEIVEGFNSPEDRLVIDSDDEGLNRETETAQKIVLTGLDDIETYESAIQNFFFRHQVLVFRTAGLRRINLRVFDENNVASNTLSRFFVVQPIFGARINLPPSLENFSVDTNEDSNYTFSASDFVDSFDDPNGSSLGGIIISALPEYGTLLLNGTAINNQDIINRTLISPDQISNLTYSPPAGFNGSDAFGWNATDGSDFAANPAKVIVRVEPVNQQPELSLPANADVEEDTATPISGISLTDPDQDEIRVRVSVSDGVLFLTPKAVEDELIDFISGTNNGEADIVFSGPAALVAFALSGLIYQPDEGFSGDDQLAVEVDDNNGGTASGNTNINILIINDAPVLANMENEPTAFEENEEPVRVSNTLTVTDEENNQISSATVTISEDYAGAQDVLAFTASNGVTGDYSEGTLTLSGNATPAVYQNILRTVSYANTSENPSDVQRTITFTVTDNGSPSATSQAVSRIVEVIPVNDAPVLDNLEEAPISYDILDNNPVAITNALTVTDVDNDNMNGATIAFEEGYEEDSDLLVFNDPIGNITAEWDEDDGVLTLSGGGTKAQYQQAIRSISYQKNGDDDDEDEDENKLISITVSDGKDESNTLSREIIIITNDPPTINSFSKTIDEDEALSFGVEDFPYEDPDNGPSQGLQSIAITALPTNGILVVANDTITNEDVENANSGFGISADQISAFQYIPTPNFSGSDNFSWNAFDGAEYAEETAEVNITITAQPDAPLPTDFTIASQEDQPYAFTAEQFANAATDPDGDELSAIVIRTVPENGTLLLNNISLPANSELSLQEINNLSYLPNENFSGQDAFTWAASDGSLLSEQSAQVIITISPVNDAPIINSFTKAIDEDEASYTFAASDFTENYLDIENTPLNFIQITSLPINGSLLLNGSAIEAGTQINAENISNLSYQAADEQEVGIISFGWNASDGSSLSAEEARVTIIIGTGVTDFSISTNEDTEYNFNLSLFANNYGNPDAPLQNIRIEALPENGALLLNGENVNVDQEISADVISQLSYLPDENYFGEDSLVWNANGGDTYAPVPAQVSITIEAVNDLPVIEPLADLTLLAGKSSEAITIIISDLETEARNLTLSASSGDNTIIPGEQIVIEGDGENRTLTLTALPETRGEVMISLIVSDGEAEVQRQFTVNVVPYLISLEVQEVLDLCPDQEETIALNIEGSEGPFTLETECDQESCELDFSEGNITLSPSETTTYYLTVVDANNIRSNVDTLTVNVNECTNLTLDIPSAFTPDGDQVNDLWEIENIQYATNVVVEVFNRYGESVFRSEGYQQPWDGTQGSTLLAVGTYYYVINVDGGLQSYKGSVTILR
ncbi:gliding motility-associated-like protein [Catalinimonas alkaloidigena]|uniref:tandem-95 repeat protein n=1 Tax=Catalinimonas alkaloidigena TaxID=1075417 RepID=UPI002404C02C|nr:tandem-95 repeat protein [Catalinimonas alkaloidigena]MDF9798451.1 gliding motility-associated-like protein [Catalinimonas alkaloidigena]